MRRFIKTTLIVLGSILLAAALLAAVVGVHVKLNVPVFLDTVQHGMANRPAGDGAVVRDVVYKTVDGRALKLDVYEPTRRLFGQSPAIVVLHGGGWMSGNKELEEDDLVRSILNCGIAIVSVDYRLAADGTTYPAPMDDAADAVRYVSAHAGGWGLDPSRLCAFGTSAGGQMALMLALAGSSFGSDDTRGAAVPIKCAVSLCGPTDFTNLEGYSPDQLAEAEALLKRLFGGPYEEKTALYRDASPIHHVAKGAPPLFVAHGTMDDTVPFNQAQRFYDAAQQAGMAVTFVPVQNANHKFNAADGGVTSPTKSELIRQLVQFLVKNLIF